MLVQEPWIEIRQRICGNLFPWEEAKRIDPVVGVYKDEIIRIRDIEHWVTYKEVSIHCLDQLKL